MKDYTKSAGGVRALASGVVLSLSLGFAPACSSHVPTSAELHESDMAGVREAERSVEAPQARGAAGSDNQPGETGARPQPASPMTPAATVDGDQIAWDSIRPSLCEAAGAQVLEEAVLDRLLDRELRRRKMPAPSAGDLASERDVLVGSLMRDARATPEQAERLLENLRRTRGLGEVRFQALLRRTAIMRALVREEVQIGDADLAVARELRFGPRYRVRVILVPTERRASEARAAVLAEPGRVPVRFADEAVRSSTDPSASRGGLLEPLSPADTTYPAALRRVLEGMEVGAVSPVVAVDNGFAIVLLEEKIPARSQDVKDAELAAELRQRLERVAMDGLARRLMAGAQVSVQDPDLVAPWGERRKGP